MDKYGAIEDEIQKIQNTGLRKILGAFRSAPIKAMQRDAEILPVSIRMKEIRDRFAIRAIRDVRFPLAHGYFHGKFGAIERLNLLRALTSLLCQSHRDKCF